MHYYNYVALWCKVTLPLVGVRCVLCPSVRFHWKTACPDFTRFSVLVACGRGSLVFWRYVLPVLWMTSCLPCPYGLCAITPLAYCYCKDTGRKAVSGRLYWSTVYIGRPTRDVTRLLQRLSVANAQARLCGRWLPHSAWQLAARQRLRSFASTR